MQGRTHVQIGFRGIDVEAVMMEENTWFKAELPRLMRKLLVDPSSRKLRLFAIACCQRIWHLLPEGSRAAVAAAERMADNEGCEAEFQHAQSRAAKDQNVAHAAYEEACTTANCRLPINKAAANANRLTRALGNAAAAASFVLAAKIDVVFSNTCYCTPTAVGEIAAAKSYESGEEFGSDQRAKVNASRRADRALNSARTAENLALCRILRDLFGNPLNPTKAEAHWRTTTVVSLAQAIYDQRRFQDMPILADALEDTGCTNQEVLAHARGEGPHVRGCWVVDLLLGKE